MKRFNNPHKKAPWFIYNKIKVPDEAKLKANVINELRDSSPYDLQFKVL